MKTTVSEKGQILIPKQLREQLGLGAGQVLECWEEQGRLVAAKAARTDPVASVYGILKLDRSTDELITELRGPAEKEGPAPAREAGAPARAKAAMITAVDTSVLLDIFGADPPFGPPSRDALRQSLAEGSVVACAIVWAEVAANFPSGSAAAEAMGRLSVAFGPLDRDPALRAGAAWKLYRARGGHRARVMADFLIGAHALTSADRLLTRDRGFYRSYFRELVLLDPTAG